MRDETVGEADDLDHDPSSYPRCEVQDSAVPGRSLIMTWEDPLTGYASPPLSPEEATALGLELLRRSMPDRYREQLLNALESWESQCRDYGYDEDLAATQALLTSLGLAGEG